jgi:hypothetical protein
VVGAPAIDTGLKSPVNHQLLFSGNGFRLRAFGKASEDQAAEEPAENDGDSDEAESSTTDSRGHLGLCDGLETSSGCRRHQDVFALLGRYHNETIATLVQ